MNPPVCPACGARLAPGTTQCDLCGHVLGDEKAAAPEVTSSDPTPVASEPSATAAPDAGSGTPPEEAPPEETLDGADCLAICTEWSEFRNPDFEDLKRRLAAPVIFDGRNLYPPSKMAELGIRYDGIGLKSG